MCRVLKKSRSQRGNRAAFGDRQLSPAVEIAPDGAIRLREIDVFAAGARQGGCQFGVGEGAGKRQGTTDHPNKENHLHRPDILDHGLGNPEDSTADYSSHDDRKGCGQPQSSA